MGKRDDIIEGAVDKIAAICRSPLGEKEREEISKAVEKAAIEAKLDGHHSAIKTALSIPEADQDTAHQIANAIERDNVILIENLKAMR